MNGSSASSFSRSPLRSTPASNTPLFAEFLDSLVDLTEKVLVDADPPLVLAHAGKLHENLYGILTSFGRY